MAEIVIAFSGLFISVIGSLALMIFSRVSKDLDKLISSVDELNVKIAVVVEKVNGHEDRLNKLEERK